MKVEREEEEARGSLEGNVTTQNIQERPEGQGDREEDREGANATEEDEG